MTTCPSAFQRVAGQRSCYMVVSPTLNNVTESRDYAEATRACQSYGAHLVTIESVQEQRHLAIVLRAQPGQQNLYIYILYRLHRGGGLEGNQTVLKVPLQKGFKPTRENSWPFLGHQVLNGGNINQSVSTKPRKTKIGTEVARHT